MFLISVQFSKRTAHTAASNTQMGASLIEVLVAILILSFGLLSMAGMLSFGVLVPKLSGYRATATYLASSHIDAIRANPCGNSVCGAYSAALNETTGWSSSAITPASSNCISTSVPGFATTKCTSSPNNTLAAADTNLFRVAVRRELPSGDIFVAINTAATPNYGEIWVIWKEPQNTVLDMGSNDQCPDAATTLYTNPKPRCLYTRFQL